MRPCEAEYSKELIPRRSSRLLQGDYFQGDYSKKTIPWRIFPGHYSKVMNSLSLGTSLLSASGVRMT
jgi:hypothetical protein